MICDVVIVYMQTLQWVLLALPRRLANKVLETLFPMLRRETPTNEAKCKQ